MGNASVQSSAVLRRSDGASNVGLSVGGVNTRVDKFADAIKVRRSVSDLVLIDDDTCRLLIDLGQSIKTDFNGSVKVSQTWSVYSSKPVEGFYLTNGTYFFALEIGESLNLVELGWEKEGKTAGEIAAIIELGCEVARRTPQLTKIIFPSGSYDVDAFVIDVDKRGFSVVGAGQDSTVLKSTAVREPSMVVLRIDPRDRAKDKLHDYLEIGDFTINGDIEGRGDSCASKVVIQSNYSNVYVKSYGHRVSNMDINGLVVDYGGHTEGRVSVSDSSVYTLNSLRLRNNAITCGKRCYVNGVQHVGGAVALSCKDSATGLAVVAGVGDTSFVVDDASGLEAYDRIEIGDLNIDVRYIISVSGNVVTIDNPLSNNHGVGDIVKLPVVSNSFLGTVEVGRVDITNAISFTMSESYLEEVQILLRGLLVNLVIEGISTAEQNPAITVDEIDKRSSVSIRNNRTGFAISMNVRDREGGITGSLDLWNMPEIEIDNNSRPQDKVLINGNAFTSIKVRRNYDNVRNDRYQTDFWFSGYYKVVGELGTESALSFVMDASGALFDGYVFDLDVQCRRVTSVNCRAGILKRAGGVSSDSSVVVSDTDEYVTSYSYSAASGNRVNVFFSGSTTRANIRCVGEQSGGADTRFMVNGKVSHLM